MLHRIMFLGLSLWQGRIVVWQAILPQYSFGLLRCSPEHICFFCIFLWGCSPKYNISQICTFVMGVTTRMFSQRCFFWVFLLGRSPGYILFIWISTRVFTKEEGFRQLLSWVSIQAEILCVEEAKEAACSKAAAMLGDRWRGSPTPQTWQPMEFYSKYSKIDYKPNFKVCLYESYYCSSVTFRGPQHRCATL